MDFVLNMMDLILKSMDFVLKTMDFTRLYTNISESLGVDPYPFHHDGDVTSVVEKSSIFKIFNTNHPFSTKNFNTNHPFSTEMHNLRTNHASNSHHNLTPGISLDILLLLCRT